MMMDGQMELTGTVLQQMALRRALATQGMVGLADLEILCQPRKHYSLISFDLTVVRPQGEQYWGKVEATLWYQLERPLLDRVSYLGRHPSHLNPSELVRLVATATPDGKETNYSEGSTFLLRSSRPLSHVAKLPEVFYRQDPFVGLKLMENEVDGLHRSRNYFLRHSEVSPKRPSPERYLSSAA